MAMLGSLLAVGLVQSPSQASGDGGDFVPVTPFRAGTDAMAPGQVVNYQVTGVGGVPTSGISAVVVDVATTATNTTSSSYVTVWPSGTTRPSVSTLVYTKDNAPRSNTAIVKVGANGQLSVYNHLGTSRIYLDVQGYFTESSQAGSSGGFVPITPKRIARSDTGQGMAQGTVPVGGSRDIQVTDGDTIPTSATAVYANIIVSDSTAAGAINLGPGGANLTGAPATINYGDNGVYGGATAVKLSTDGKLRLMNTVGSPITVRVDVQGYFSGSADEGAHFTPLTPALAYSSSGSGQTALAGDETRTIKLAGRGGIPDNGRVEAASLVVTVKNWTSGGAVTLWSSDLEARPLPPTATFVGTTGSPSTGFSTSAITVLSVNGEVNITNTSADPVHLQIAATGVFNVPESEAISEEVAPSEAGLTPEQCLAEAQSEGMDYWMCTDGDVEEVDSEPVTDPTSETDPASGMDGQDAAEPEVTAAASSIPSMPYHCGNPPYKCYRDNTKYIADAGATGFYGDEDKTIGSFRMSFRNSLNGHQARIKGYWEWRSGPEINFRESSVCVVRKSNNELTDCIWADGPNGNGKFSVSSGDRSDVSPYLHFDRVTKRGTYYGYVYYNFVAQGRTWPGNKRFKLNEFKCPKKTDDSVCTQY